MIHPSFLIPGVPVSGVGFDLASLNIQRGRDHGILKYNALRENFGLRRVTSVEEITSNPVLQHALMEAYGDNVDNIDAWVGGLAEDHVPLGMVGELFATIIGNQFRRSMLGDPMFYLNDPDLQDDHLIEHVIDVSQIKLADILGFNTNHNVTNDNVFRLVVD